MTKQGIIKGLSEGHIVFVHYILSLSYKEFTFSVPGKWTAGQQMDHIYRTTSFLPLAFRIPTLITGLMYGKATRPSMEYDELVQKYLSHLQTGVGATGLFIPGDIPYSQRTMLADKLLDKVSRINNALDLLPERDLDRSLLPHPILGKITYREMLYFTIYHVNHHCALVKKYTAEIR